MPCACGRPFVPDVDMYHAHVQTPEHQRWRLVQERGREPDDLMWELYRVRERGDARRELERMRHGAEAA